VLLYYAIANASALTLEDRRRVLPALGLAGCLLLAVTLLVAR
jgi:APA family basic amino acid/polyamine antiporter